MGNGASCGENARDVGADEELNPMLMGDADKENNYRRPSVPHVQAVRVQCPLDAVVAFPPPRAGTTKSTYHAPPTQEGWLAWATPNGSTRRYYRLVGSYLVRYADEEAARGASSRRLDRWRLHGRERVYASRGRVDGVDADASPRRRRRVS